MEGGQPGRGAWTECCRAPLAAGGRTGIGGGKGQKCLCGSTIISVLQRTWACASSADSSRTCFWVHSSWACASRRASCRQPIQQTIKGRH